MRATILPTEPPDLPAVGPSAFDGAAQKLLFRFLERLERGRLILRDGGREYRFGGRGGGFPLEAAVTVHHPRFYSSVVFGGSVGAGEAYMARFWSADDLTAVIRIFVLNQHLFRSMDRGWAALASLAYKYFHWRHKDTREGSRINIAAHYDLGNDFYALFLDETLTYSCGIFEREDSSLKDASLAKYDRLCRKLDLSPRDHVLEIGTGWGGFAVHAAETCGCRVTTTTISRAQFELAGERIRQAGLSDRIRLLLEDYRDLAGKYDKLVSIEMIEAVGHPYYDAFFGCCGDLLKENGMMALQAITMADYAFERHKGTVDFIKRYIFPGSCIPSVTAMCDAMARSSDLRLFHLEDITPHYARTLRTWRENFLSRLDEVRALGYSETFIRMWEYYLCYCEAGFAERYLGDVQMILVKPLCRRAPILPELAIQNPP